VVAQLFRMTVVGFGILLSLLALLAAVSIVGARMIARAHPPAGRFVEVGGGRLHIVDIDERTRPSADDPPVVLLHGASSNLEDMRLALADSLKARHRVIIIDRPGHGWSERSADHASPAQQAAMVAEALERLDVGRAIVVAHSFAGSVATSLALDDPGRVAGLVLLAPVLYPWSTGIAWYYSLVTTPVLGPLFAHTLAVPVGAVVMRPVAASVFAPQVAPADYTDRAAIALVLRPQAFLANARDVAGLHAFVTRQAPRYSGIKAPTVIITGDRDTVVSPDIHARALAAKLPNSKLVVLEGVGHMPHYAVPDRVAAAIDDVAAEANNGVK
jgi:pimeloyl-ACP methyl ester carboxylesterase